MAVLRCYIDAFEFRESHTYDSSQGWNPDLPQVEVLDFCGPFEVFSVTRLDDVRRREERSPYEVVLITEQKEPVVATGGMKVIPDYSLDDCPPLDILVVPGGWGDWP